VRPATRRHVRAPPARLRGLYRYPRSWRRGDLLAGATVAAYLVPQVMAYAQVAGLRPAAGLWAAVPALVIYAVLGSSRSLSLGQEATTALMTAAAIGPLAAGHPALYAALASSLALLVGLMAVIARGARLGFVADLLSRPVVVGYLAGVALIMIAGSLLRRADRRNRPGHRRDRRGRARVLVPGPMAVAAGTGAAARGAAGLRLRRRVRPVPARRAGGRADPRRLGRPGAPGHEPW